MAETIEEVMDNWKKEIGYDPSKPRNDNEYKRDLLHEVWTPRWKWVRPVLGWIGFKWYVRWAYNIKKTLFRNVYPIGIPSLNSSIPVEPDIKLKAGSETELLINAASYRLEREMNNRILEEINKEECSNVKVSEPDSE